MWFHARRDNRDCEAAPFPSILYLLHSGRAISRVLYWTIIYLDLPLLTSSSDLPTGRWRAATLGPYLVLLRMGFTRPVCLHTAGELLPHHFNLTTAVLFRRNVSVALSLQLPAPDVIRHSCPAEPGLSSYIPKMHAIVCLTQNIKSNCS